MMKTLFILTSPLALCMDTIVARMMLEYFLTVTQVRVRMQISQSHTMTQQEKEGAFFQATQAVMPSKFRNMKRSKSAN